jgi:hypothetical protein
MRVLFYNPYIITPHFETDLELIQNHLNSGNEVFILQCRGELHTCFYNSEHSEAKCNLCRSRFQKGIGLVKSDRLKVLEIPIQKEYYPELPSEFKNIDELKAFNVDGAEIGLAAASNAISTINREHRLDTIKHQEFISKLLNCAYYTFLFFKKTLESLNPDQVYIFNGRFSTHLPAINACEQLNIKYYTHERGGTLNKYWLVKNYTVHDIKYSKKEINEYWENANEVERNKIGKQFFIDSRSRVEHAWYSFTKNQQLNKLPANFDIKKKNIVFFNSTIEEYAAVRGWDNPIPIYGNELNAFKTIFNSFKDDENIHFYLRVHPNLKGYKNSQTDDIDSLKNMHPNLTIISPDEPVDSYALVDNCDVTLTFFSTIGIEACFWNKPAILLGQSVYEDLGGTYNPKSHDELVALLKSDLEPKDNIAAIKYGYWALMRGTEFKYFVPTSLTTGLFKGKEIKPSKLALFKAALLFLFRMRGITDLKFIIKYLKEKNYK